MANYNVTISASGNGPNFMLWQGSGGTSSGGALALLAGDTVSFKKLGTYSGSFVISGFSTGLWTSGSNLTLTTSYQSRTVKSGGTVGFVDALTATAGNKSQTRYFKVGGVEPDLAITDVVDITRPNGSTNHAITIAAGTSTTTYEVRTGSASGTVYGTRSGNGAITVSNIPSAGASATYYVTGKVTAANGGNNTAALADTYIVVHEAAAGSASGNGGTGTFGLRAFDASGNITLDLTDRVVTFRQRVTGSLSASQITKTITLSSAGTCVINLTPLTVIFVNNIPQRQKILYATISGTALTIKRTATNAAGSANAAQAYDYLVVNDPVN